MTLARGFARPRLSLSIGALLLSASAGAASPPPLQSPDRDGDGIVDAKDACVDEAGPASTDAKRHGCPTDGIASMAIRGNAIVLERPVVFVTGKPQVATASNTLMVDLARVIETRGANIDLLEIAVHSDDSGNEALNLALTDARAKAIGEALQARGVAGARLRTIGYGSACPLDPAATAEARAKNRRVEITLLKRGGTKTNAPVGCSAAAAKGIALGPVP